MGSGLLLDPICSIILCQLYGSWGAYVCACLLSNASVASTRQAEASRKEEAHPSAVLQLGRIIGLCKPRPVMV